jgi:hypothetical protein
MFTIKYHCQKLRGLWRVMRAGITWAYVPVVVFPQLEFLRTLYVEYNWQPYPEKTCSMFDKLEKDYFNQSENIICLLQDYSDPLIHWNSL